MNRLKFHPSHATIPFFELFQDVRRHRLVSPKAVIHKTFYDALSELQRTVLHLLGQTPAAYFSAGEQRA
jgi:hypothetical protein